MVQNGMSKAGGARGQVLGAQPEFEAVVCADLRCGEAVVEVYKNMNKKWANFMR